MKSTIIGIDLWMVGYACQARKSGKEASISIRARQLMRTFAFGA